jgi:rhamnosyltransferase
MFGLRLQETMTVRLQRGIADGSICAVIVSYFPDPIRLAALVESVQSQVDLVLIVDNGSSTDALLEIRRLESDDCVKLIEFGENRGIAAAHNAGIRHAMENAFEFVLLLDHDSRLSPDCVSQLLEASRRLSGAGIKLAAVGPQYDDDTSAQRAPFWRFFRWSYRRIYAQPGDEVVETSVLISSGTLISCATLKLIGMMDETLFIDGVDWEWCFRATASGYRLFGVPSAIMQHSLGDGGIKILGRILPLHSPLRHYYVYRNMVLMCRMVHIPMSWKFYFSLRLAIRFVIYVSFAPHRLMRCRKIWRGLRDGFSGRFGRFELTPEEPMQSNRSRQ